MKNLFKIGNTSIGGYLRPYIIAEIGVNHECDMALAKRLIDEAAGAGAHAAKFQTYKAATIASKNSPAYWDQTKEATKSQYELFKRYDAFGQEEYVELARHCALRGVHFLSTPFDLDAVDFLNELVPAFKIASADITNVPLIRKCAATGKPIILSTGAASLPEIEFSLNTAQKSGAQDIALLHCVLNYPTPIENAQLNYIEVLQRSFPDCAIGYSDHVVPDGAISALQQASLMGSVILEKHFTHDKTLPGNDHYHAMDQHDLVAFIAQLEVFRALYGPHHGKNLELEQSAILHARRSLVASRPIRSGEPFTANNLIAKRPGHGISPVHWDMILTQCAARDLQADELLSWEQIQPCLTTKTTM